LNNDDPRTILVFGATGRQGGAVAKALLRAQWAVRALVRDPAAPSSTTLRAAGVELVQGSFADADAMRAAMSGAHGVFSVRPGNLPERDEVRFGTAIADVAADAGVGHLVYSSGASVGEELTGIPRFDAKPRIEAHIRQRAVTWTIVRPMIFMESLLGPGLGLNEGRFTFFLEPDRPLQLVAVDDIGRVVAAVFAGKTRFGGRTLKIASDTVTGRELAAIFTEAAGRPIAYSRFPDEVLTNNPDLAHMAKSLEDGPLSAHVDLDAMREINPDVLSFRSWLAGSGRKAFETTLGIVGS